MVLVLSLLWLQALPQGTAVLQGHVLRAGTTTPVSHANVVVAKVGGTAEDYRASVTDAAGAFIVRDASPGTYRIYAEHEGYLRAEFGARLFAAPGSRVTIGAGQTSPDLRIDLTPTGVITGRVAENGRPAREVIVRAWRMTYFYGQPHFDVAGFAETDDLGEYRVFDLRPGAYLVSALPRAGGRVEGTEWVVPVVATAANGNRREIRSPLTAELLDPAAFAPGLYVPVFYSDTTNPALAASVRVAAGTTAVGIDFTLARASVFSVHGEVAGIDAGTGASNVRVQLRPKVRLTTSFPQAVQSAAGMFVIQGVPPGAYYLSVDAGGPDRRMSATTEIEVIDRDVETPLLTLQPGSTVTGHVSLDGGTGPLPLASVQLLAGPEQSIGLSAVQVGRDGTFAVGDVPPGDYQFRVLLPRQTFWIKSARFGGTDVLESPIRVDSDAKSRNFDIVLSLKTATLDVSVLDDARAPVAGALVIAIPVARRRHRPELYVTATADTGGRAHLVGLAPGEYRVFATVDLDADAWSNPDVVRSREAAGTVVVLAEQARGNVTLGLTR